MKTLLGVCLRTIDILQDLCKGISTSKVEDSFGELAQLSLFELENLRCTSAQHNVVQFLIEFRKSNIGMIVVKDESITEKIHEFYTKSLKLNSPVNNEVIL